MRDDIIEGYNWTKFPFREDPNTHQRICKDCWNGVHGEWKATSATRRFVKGCLVDGCCCFCYAAQADIKHESARKRAATVARKAADKEALGQGPMRAVRE